MKFLFRTLLSDFCTLSRTLFLFLLLDVFLFKGAVYQSRIEIENNESLAAIFLELEINNLFRFEVWLALNLLDIIDLAENVDSHILVRLSTETIIRLLYHLLWQTRLGKLPLVLSLSLLVRRLAV